MSEFLSPGVFVEEVATGPKPIEGVSTSTAGAVGVTAFGPTAGKPVLVTSFAEFVRIFGPPVPEPPEPLLSQWAREKEGGRWWQFALSIKGFFDNGGQRIFVKRVFSKSGARAAAVEIHQGVFTDIEADAKATDATLKLRNVIGISRIADLTVFNPEEVGTFDVVAYDPVTRTVRLDRQLGKAVQAGKSFVRILPVKSEPTFTVRAKALGRWGNDLRAQVRPMAGATASLLADPGLGAAAVSTKVAASGLTWAIELADGTGLEAPTLTSVEIKGKPFKIANPSEHMRTFEILGNPPPDLFSADEAVGETQKLTLTVAADVSSGNEITCREKVSAVSIGDRFRVKGKSFKVIAKPTDNSLKVKPDFSDKVEQGLEIKVLTPNEDGLENLLIGIGSAKTQAGTATDKFKLLQAADAANLEVGDRIEVANKVHTVIGKTPPTGDSELTVSPAFDAPLAADTKIRKFKLLVTAGTLKNMSLTIDTALQQGSRLIFLPAQKELEVVSRTGSTIHFTPPVPQGRDWTSLPVEYSLTTQVKTEVTTAQETIELKDVSFLKKGDSIVIGGAPHRLLEDPSPGTTAPEGTVKATPGFSNVGKDADVTKIIRTTVAENTADWTVEVDSAAGFKTGSHVLINGEELVVSVLGNQLRFSSRHDGGDPWNRGSAVRLLRAARGANPKIVNVSGAAQLYKGAIVELDNGRDKDVAVIEGIDGDKVTLNPAPTNTYLEGHKLRVIEAEILVRQVVNNQVVQQESFTNLRLVDDKTTSYFVTAIKNGSSLIEIADPLGTGFPDTPDELAVLANFPASGGGPAALAGGQEGLESLTVDDFEGADGGSGKRTGIQALEDIDEVSVCLAPDVWAPTVHQALILHCETLKDRFAILDPQDGLSIEQIRDVRENLDSKYAALYYPWLEVRDSFAGRNVQVAPSGHLAGIYARVDVERGVHKAPANEIIRGITRIADEVTKREQDLLNPKGINALRFFPGRGMRVWGARTISSDSSWKYVNVRRLFNFVEESIKDGTEFVVFEPNAESTWAVVQQTIANFLTTVWRSGALEGTTADQAFFVRCDRTTMTQDDIDNGRLICLVGIAPVKPAEFVIIRISQKTRDSNP